MFDSMTYAYHMSYNGIKFIHNFFHFLWAYRLDKAAAVVTGVQFSVDSCSPISS